MKRLTMFGTIVLASNRGFWFAEVDSTHQSVFVHQRNVKQRRFLHVNDRIQFELAPSPIKLGEIEAVNVEWLGIVIGRQSSGAVRP
jgi:cold shock CspA family protein